MSWLRLFGSECNNNVGMDCHRIQDASARSIEAAVFGHLKIVTA